MRTAQTIALSLLTSLLTAALWATPTAATVRVSFADPARFTDSNLYDANALGAIKVHLQRLGARYIDPKATLTITVLDFDLAGHDLSSTGPSHLRVLNGATPPKIRLRYRLERNHKVVASGEDAISDQLYLSRPGVGLSTDVLKYEKAMLDDWFRQKFSAGRTPAR